MPHTRIFDGLSAFITDDLVEESSSNEDPEGLRVEELARLLQTGNQSNGKVMLLSNPKRTFVCIWITSTGVICLIDDKSVRIVRDSPIQYQRELKKFAWRVNRNILRISLSPEKINYLEGLDQCLRPNWPVEKATTSPQPSNSVDIEQRMFQEEHRIVGHTINIPAVIRSPRAGSL